MSIHFNAARFRPAVVCAALVFAGFLPAARAASETDLSAACGPQNSNTFTASQGACTGLVEIAWPGVEQALSYAVWRNVSNVQSSAALVAEVASNSWSDASVENGTRYYYWVFARTAQGDVPVDAGSAARGYAGLPPPEMIAASDGTQTNCVLVTWSAVSNATGYEVWRQTTNEEERAACLAVTDGTAFEDKTAADVTLYIYWVVATNRLCRSASGFYDTGFRQLPAPLRVKASMDSYTDRVHVAWAAMSNAVSYEVWRGAKDQAEQAEKLGCTHSNFWDDAAAIAGATYFYWVRAITDVGLGAFSAPEKGRRKCLIAQLRPPARVQASDGTFSDKVLIAWQAVSNASGYEIWRTEASNAPIPALMGISSTNFFNDTKACTGTVYGYSVRSTNAQAVSQFSRPDKGFVGEPKIPPPAPASVFATQGALPAAVRIQWSAVEEAKRYEIWRSLSPQPPSAQLLGAVSGRALAYNDASAAHGTRYYYWVRSVNGVVTGNFSAVCSGFRPLPPPSAPAASAGLFGDKVRITWNGVTNAGLYEIWRAPSNTFASALRINSASSTTYDDASALPGVRYFYWITAKNAACPGVPSVAAIGYRPLPAPRNVSASDGAYPDRVQVSWKSLDNVLRYEIWRGLTNSPSGARRIGVSVEPAFSDRSAAPGARYYYFVRAVGSAGVGPFGECNMGHRLPKPPNSAIGGGVGAVFAAPTLLNATDGAHIDKVRLTWKAASGATAYEVWRGTSDQLNRATRIGQTSGTAFDDHGAEPGKEYSYWVRGFNGAGAGGYSAATQGYRQLPAPVGLKAHVSSDGAVCLNWSGVTQAEQYEVWRNPSAQSANAVLLAVVSRTGFEDASVLPGVAYNYRLKARNGLGASPLSASITAAGPIAAPAGVQATQGELPDRVRVLWRASEGVASYEVWRSSDLLLTNAARVATLSETAFDDAAPVPGAAYTYWVRARVSGAASAYSAPAIGFRPLAAPAGISAGDGSFDDRIRVVWRAVTNATGYEIWRSPLPQPATSERVGLSAATNFDDLAVPTTADFCYWVRATNELGAGMFGSSNFGFRQLAAPETIRASDGAGTGGVSVGWSIVPEALGYEIWRSDSASSSAAKRVAKTSASNYIDSAAPQGVLQWYWVKATNSLRVGHFSPSNDGYRLLETPSEINATDGSFVDKVKVTWKATPNASGYEIMRAPCDDLTRATCIGCAKGAAYDDCATADGATNFYWVRATNALCAGAWSFSDSGFRRQALQPPAAPQNVSAGDGAYPDKVRIAWKLSNDAASYRVYRSAPEMDAIRLLGETSKDFFDDTQARPGITYAYQVAGRNAAGIGAFSAPDLGRRGGVAALPPQPTGIAASDGLFPDRIVVTWHAAPDADCIEIWRGLTDAIESAVRIAAVETRAFEDSDVARGARYFYRLRAKNAQGLSEFSAYDSGYAGAQPVKVAVAGDYDGDAISDLALFHYQTGEWFVRSAAGEVLAYAQKCGNAGFLALPGDYDGDGINDFAAYDTETGAWFLTDANGGIILLAEIWGGPGWTPVAGDFDGDGIADLAVYENATGKWNIRAVDGRILLFGAVWGGEGFLPVAAPAQLPLNGAP